MPTALITGASKGIGRAVARDLARDHHVIAVARSADRLESLVREIESAGGSAEALPLDLRDGAAIRSALEGREVDVLVNNAGVGSLKPFVELTADEWHEMLDVNLTAIFHATQALLPGMMRRGRGHVVIVGSIAGRSAFKGGTAYGATKHALMGFAESLMLEVRERDVKVSIVNPGSVETAFGGGEEPADGAKGWALAAADVANAVGHIVRTPQDVLLHRVEIRATHPRK